MKPLKTVDELNANIIAVPMTYYTCERCGKEIPSTAVCKCKEKLFTQQEVDKLVIEAEQRGVAWVIGAIDDLHINHTDTLQMSGDSDRLYKGIKNTIRDRFKTETGVDPAPDYPVKARLSHKERED